MKIPVDGQSLKYLAKMSIENGTEKNWISIALEWILEAEKEIVRLRELIEKENGKEKSSNLANTNNP